MAPTWAGPGLLTITETFLTSDIFEEHLHLKKYKVYRSDRKSKGCATSHGGVLFALQKELVKNSSGSVTFDEFDGCLLVFITVHPLTFTVCVLYNTPEKSLYRWEINYFKILLNYTDAKLKLTLIIICRDLNFSGTHWESNFSDDEYGQTVLNLFDQCNFQQILDIPTCGNNTLDVLCTRNFPPINFDCDLLFEKRVYNLSDHRAVSLSFEATIPAPKPVIECCYSYNKADYTAIRHFMLENPFEPVYYTNADIATANWYKYINDIIHQFVPRRTYHRQSLPPWVSSSTSHLMKILQAKEAVEKTHRIFEEIICIKLKEQ